MTDPSPTRGTPTAWAAAVDALRAYQRLRGTVDVPHRVRAFGVDLGKWVAQVRGDYWDATLTAAHIQDLDSVDGWQWGPERPASWRHHYHLLAAHAHRHHTTVLVDPHRIDGTDLHAWAAAQQAAYAHHELTGPQIALLESLPDWQWDPDEYRWQQGLSAAKAYLAQHHTIDGVDRTTRLGDFPLGQWVHRCRVAFRAGTLTDTRAAQLEELPGWRWTRSQQTWTRGLTVLQGYTAATGHASPTQHTVVDGYPLGWWVTQKRRQYRQGTLPPDWVHTLEALPGWRWAPLDEQWQRGLQALHHYAELHGHADPARGHRIDDYPVGDWARAQRDAFDRGRLTPTRIAHLAAIPGWRWHRD